MKIADQFHIVFTQVSSVWWWVYGAKLEVLKNESAELAMNIQVTFPYAGDLKGRGVFCEDPMFAEAATPQRGYYAQLPQTNESHAAIFLLATHFM